MGMPKRLKEQTGRFSLVDGIAFQLPVGSHKTPALIAAFSINADKAKALMPGNELHPYRLWNKGLLVITVVNYQVTNIGSYIEYSIAIACTHGSSPAMRLLPGLFTKTFGTGQYVFDLPVSTEISVKGGKGIWGMPKHQASMDFLVGDEWVSSQYDLDGELAMRIDVKRRHGINLNIGMSGTNYCAFRGMLMASYIYFKGSAAFSLFKADSARLVIGNHPRLQPLKELETEQRPIFAGYFSETQGVLDDHFECWFLSQSTPPSVKPEGMESVVDLGLSQTWPKPPAR